MTRHVALVGFMAAGKSTAGKRAAVVLRREFIDTDALIAAEHGSIAAIFERRGERAFRMLEREAAARSFAGEAKVVALGGGAITFEPTRILIAGSALRVYLRASPETIFRRVKRSRTPRPLLGQAPTLERITELLAAREPYYAAADIVVPVDGRRMLDVVAEIVERVRAADSDAA